MADSVEMIMPMLREQALPSDTPSSRLVTGAFEARIEMREAKVRELEQHK